MIRRKYGNRKIEFCGEWFDSKRELKRWQELILLLKARLISELQRQVKYEIVPACGKERAAHYVADFQYLENGAKVVEDAKGMRTREYILKRKLMQHVHGIVIREV